MEAMSLLDERLAETKPKPHPSLILALSILDLIEARRDKKLDYRDAIAALEATAVLLRAKDDDDPLCSTTTNVYAMDSQSFRDYLIANPDALSTK
jgi:hypothetical protein